MELYSVMVTGANRGIGFEFVSQFAKLTPPPRHIFATYRNENTLEDLKAIRDATVKKPKVHLIKMDLTNEEDIQNSVKFVDSIVKEKGLTLLINNAAVLNQQQFPDVTGGSLKFNFITNSVGPFLLTQGLYPLLKKSAIHRKEKSVSFSRAGIVTISTIFASLTFCGVEAIKSRVVPFQISKVALNMSMRIIAADSKKDDILVVMICPGWVKTNMGLNIVFSGTELEILSAHGIEQIEAAECVTKILGLISKLDGESNGSFLDRNGEKIPY